MPYITTKEASLILKVSKRTLFRWEEEGRIKSTREGILKVRVYDRDYIVLVKKLLDLDQRIDEHNSKFREIIEKTKKHQLEQDYTPGKRLHLMTPEEAEAANEAFDAEEAWDIEHKSQMAELGLLIQELRGKFPNAPLKELLLKEERNK